MKVIIASRLFAPEVAAAAFRLKALADALSAAGHQVTVLTTKPPGSAPIHDHADYNVSRWPVLRDPSGNVRGYVQYASFDLPLLVRLLAHPADAVIAEPPPTTGVVAALTCLVKRVPFYYYAPDVWSDALLAIGAPASVIRLIRFLERFAMQRARLVIAVSDEVAQRVCKLGVSRDRVRVVANGVDTAVFRPGPGAVDKECRYFVYTGTMSEWQGSDIFVRALPIVLKKYPEVRLRIFGQGAAEHQLRSLAAELAPENVEFGGVVPPADAARWISGSTGALVSIKPGQGYDFAKPTKIYAAAACGTPVLFAGAGAGASAKLVSAEDLGVVAEYTPEAVAEKMIALLEGRPVDSERLVNWARQNASLSSSGGVAAQRISEDLRRW